MQVKTTIRYQFIHTTKVIIYIKIIKRKITSICEMWGNWGLDTLLIGMEEPAATVEDSTSQAQKVKPDGAQQKSD